MFAEYLLSIGDGTYPLTELPSVITIPEFISCTAATLDEMKGKIYPNLQEHAQDEKWLSERAILAPLNDTVNHINASLIHQFPGDMSSPTGQLTPQSVTTKLFTFQQSF